MLNGKGYCYYDDRFRTPPAYEEDQTGKHKFFTNSFLDKLKDFILKALNAAHDQTFLFQTSSPLDFFRSYLKSFHPTLKSCMLRSRTFFYFMRS